MRIYIESTMPSYVVARPARDLLPAARQQTVGILGVASVRVSALRAQQMAACRQGGENIALRPAEGGLVVTFYDLK